ncbi:hypothetical protein KCU92_g2920, partial [Aureobasidium melanogenum]
MANWASSLNISLAQATEADHPKDRGLSATPPVAVADVGSVVVDPEAAAHVLAPLGSPCFVCHACGRTREGDAPTTQLNDIGTMPCCKYCDQNTPLNERMVWCVVGKHAVPEEGCPFDSCPRHPPSGRGIDAQVPKLPPPNNLQVHDPVLTDASSEVSALTDADIRRTTAFDSAMNSIQERYKICPQCRESRMDTKVNEREVCHKCSREDRPNKFLASNDMQPKGLTPDLIPMTPLEEMMLALRHGHCEILKVRPGKPSGEVFIQMFDAARNNSKLPVPVENCPMVVIAPKDYSLEQFDQDCLVRRQVVLTNAMELQRSHPGYKDKALIDFAAITALPLQEVMTSHLVIQRTDSSSVSSVPVKGRAIRRAIPNLLSRKGLSGNVFPPSDSSTTFIPARDLNRSVPYLSAASPSIYPCGECEFVSPRSQPVDFKEYLVHLIRHKDRRFINHPSWLSVAFCLLQNQQINSRSQWLGTKKFPRDMSDQEIESAIYDDDTDLIRRVFDHGSILKGSQSWWTVAKRDLAAVVMAVGHPHIFLTLTANPLEWTALHALLPGYDDTVDQDALRTLISENPDVVVEFFVERRELFFKHVVNPKFDVVDSWGRFEFQKDGGIHWHGVLWCRNAPDPRSVSSDVGRVRIAGFWNTHIVANLPVSNSAEPHPQVAKLNDLVSRLQQHDCSKSSYCVADKCKYGYPMELRDQAQVIQVDDGYRVHPARNNDRVVAYNRALLLTWLANIDIQVLTGLWWILWYICKWLLEHEDILTELPIIIEAFEPNTNPLVIKIRSILEQLVGSKAFTREEICHLLLDLPLVTSTVEVIRVDTRADLNTHARSSVLVKYLARDKSTLASETLVDFILKRNLRHMDRTIAKARVPRYVPLPTGPDAVMWKVMLQHAFFNNPRDYLEGNGYPNWQAAQQACLQHGHTRPDYMPETVERVPVDPQSHNDWRNLARQLRQSEDTVKLGRRPTDAFDYSAMVGDIAGLDNTFWTRPVTNARSNTAAASSLRADADRLLDPDQSQLYHDVMDSMDRVLAGQDFQFLSQVDGGAGSGKTFVCQLITDHVNQLAMTMNQPTPAVKVMAPTGVAAKNIGGETLHSALRIFSANFLPLMDAGLLSLRKEWQDIRLVVIDEKSMISRNILWQIDQRLRHILDRHDRPFGGMSVILVGDFVQIQPVAGAPLYQDDRQPHYEVAYRAFSKSYFLRSSHRHENDGRLLSALDAIRDDKVTHMVWQHLSERCMTHPDMTATEIASFDNALRLYFNREPVRRYNERRLTDARSPVLAIPAVNLPPTPAVASVQAEDAHNLEPELLLSIGCPVIVTENICKQAGVVNGSTGVVTGYRWHDEQDPAKTAPFAVMVKMDDFRGNAYHNLEVDGVANDEVPIFAVRRPFTSNSKQCYRTQFPLFLAWAATVHKAQGLTLDKVVLDIADSEFAPGLIYTAISRVRKLANLLFEQPFGLNRLTKGLNKESMQERQDDEARRGGRVMYRY